MCGNRVAKQLGSVDDMTKKEARAEAKNFLAKINQPTLTPETAVTFTAFVESVYLPHAEGRMRPSTYRGYKVLWREVKPFCEGLWTREVRTRHMQAILESMAKTNRFNVNSLKHIKSFLSGIFRLADQQGYYEGANPVRETSLPQVRPADEFRSYVDNGVEDAAALEAAAALPSRPDSVAEVKTSGPRYATDVMAENRAAATLGADAQAKYLRCRAIFHEHFARFNQKDFDGDFRDYLAFVEHNQEAREYYISTRKRLTSSITQAQLSDENAARLFDLRLPNVAFLMTHIGSQQPYMGLLFPGLRAMKMKPANIRAVRWQECDRVYQNVLQQAQSPLRPTRSWQFPQ